MNGLNDLLAYNIRESYVCEYTEVLITRQTAGFEKVQPGDKKTL